MNNTNHCMSNQYDVSDAIFKRGQNSPTPGGGIVSFCTRLQPASVVKTLRPAVSSHQSMKISGTFQRRYQRTKKVLLTDSRVHEKNRVLLAKFLSFEEQKLKRINQHITLDEPSYNTLYTYILRIRNVLTWFSNKPLASLTESDIRQVYNDLEDGVIVTQRGQPFKSRRDYYNKIFKSTLFDMAGQGEIVRKIIQYSTREDRTVRFVTEQDFRMLVDYAIKPHHKILLWLAFDIGENINALLQLRTTDCQRRPNPDTGEIEYAINLRKEILKRSRRSRTELTNYLPTVQLLDEHLANLQPGDALFTFGYANAKKIIDRIGTRCTVRCQPTGEKVTWKVLRSSMACDLLTKGWTLDEVKSRLGHTPSSDAIDHYVTYLALSRHRPKRKVHQFHLQELEHELEQVKQRERLQQQRNDQLLQQLTAHQHATDDKLKALRQTILDELKSELKRSAA